MAYLPPEHAVEGTELRVMYMNELFPVTRRAGRQPARCSTPTTPA